MKFNLTNNPVIKGDFKYVPKKESNIVRIFLSSTFTDMSEERNVLMKTVFPELQSHFRAKGFDFEVVDMRWGVREEMVNDHLASKLCEDEISRAQTLSQGVSFITLLGDKYGSCPLPSTIPDNHYSTFFTVLQRAKIDSRLLTSWYILDENARNSIDEKPSIYVLAPITDKFKFFNSTDPSNAEIRLQERQQWQNDQAQLRELLQKAASLAHDSGIINEEEKQLYFMAVTEREISNGILRDQLAPVRSLCFMRTFEHFKETDENAHRYADIVNCRYDLTSKLYLTNLKTKLIPAALAAENIFQYKIPWNPQGINQNEVPSHKVYIDQLCADVKRAVIEFSERRIAQKPKLDPTGWNQLWYSDLLHHADFCNTRSTLFVDRRKLRYHCIRALGKNEFQIIRPKGSTQTWESKRKSEEQDEKEAMQAESAAESSADEENVEEPAKRNMSISCHKPLVVYGVSGSGKTSIVAKLASSFSEIYNSWLDGCPQEGQVKIDKDRLVKVVRFLGTSPSSCTVREVLFSVITQLLLALDISDKKIKVTNLSFSALCEYFEHLLWQLESFKGNILIVFDAVDQLRQDDGAYSMTWIPLTFPTNIHMIVSMFETHEDNTGGSESCLDNLRKLLPDESCYVQIHELSMDTAKHIVELYGANTNRFLTSAQQNLVLNAFTQCQQPMYLKLIFELAKDWKSFTDVSSVKFGKNCKEVIGQLFNKLELQHGRALVFSLKYLTAAKEGLADSEIEDLLSLDDEVLQDVYVYHLPPESSIIRLPPMLWRRIRQQLSEYLAEKEADGKTVVTWYHRQFWETAKFHSANNQRIHTKMAEYFSGQWYNVVKPLLLYKGKKAEYPNSSRNAPPMPNCYSDTEPNLRKLNELPYHLISSYQLDESADLLTDFHFLMCKLKFMGLKKLLEDFRYFFDVFAPGKDRTADLAYLKLSEEFPNENRFATQLPDQIIEMKIVLEMLLMSADDLTVNSHHLAGHIIGRLTQMWLRFPRVRKLHQQAKKWSSESNSSLLIPRFACLQQPGSLLRASIPNVVNIPRRNRDYYNFMHFNGKLLYAREQLWNNKDVIQVYDLSNFGEAVQTIKFKCDIFSMKIFRNEKMAIVRTFSKSRNHNSPTTDIVVNMQTKVKIDLNVGKMMKLVLSNSELVIVVIQSNNLSIFDINEAQSTLNRRAPDTVSKIDEWPLMAASFNFDDSVLILINESGVLFGFDVERLQIIWKNDATLTNNGNCRSFDFETFLFYVLQTDKFVCRGLDSESWFKLFIFDLKSGEQLQICEGETYSLDSVLIHKSEKWIAAATHVVDTVKVDSAAKLRNKPLFVFDIETGERVHRVRGNKGAFIGSTFLGNDHEYLAFSRKFDPGIVIVHVGTPDEPSHSCRQLLKLNGHTQAATRFLTDPLDNYLISTSIDNHIKVWDLHAILTICKVNVDHPNMQKPLDRRDKSDQHEFLQNADGETTDSQVTFKGNLAQPLDRKLMGGCHAYVLDMSNDNRYVVSGCMFGRLVFFDLHSGDFTVVQGHVFSVKRVHTVIFSKGTVTVGNVANFVVSSASEPNIHFWDPTTGSLLRTIESGLKVNQVTLMNEFCYVGGLRLNEVSAKMESIFQKYSLISESKLFEHKFAGECVAFEKFVVVPQSNFICTWADRKILVYEQSNENQLVETPYDNYKGEPDDSYKRTAIKSTKDGRYVVCGAFRHLHILSLKSDADGRNKEVILHETATAIRCFDFTEDEDYVLVCGYRAIAVVHLITGQELRKIPAHSEFAETIQLVDQYVITVSTDRSLLFHKLDTKEIDFEQQLTSFVFHCAVRLLLVASDLSFILVGPESAAPLAVLSLNDALRAEIKSYTPAYPGIPNWLTPMEDVKKVEQTEQPNANVVRKLKLKLTDIKMNDDDFIELYVDDVLSCSISKEHFEMCKSLSSPFSSNSGATHNMCNIL